ncbi:protein-ADP-ribose hydrolase [Jeotgalicoccus saudimassiliensis]|nr:protein-ADP-ribose hydrolase [Jeotgalicoccus saudimassiliensis]
MTQTDRLHFLISYMQQEKNIAQSVPDTFAERFEVFRGLANERPAQKVSREFLDVQDAFLSEYNAEGITEFESLSPGDKQLYIWQGDITTLKIEAVVNAANAEMLGCLIPNHNCIDNIIHTKAGAELRLECADIMKNQGRKEAVGRAKITSAYNLPSEYIIHTVGPVVQGGKVSPMKQELLAKCYRSCLELADENNIRSIAFCSISTGVFGYPKEEAAGTAVETVKQYLAETGSEIDVVFNVFGTDDLKIYENLLT